MVWYKDTGRGQPNSACSLFQDDTTFTDAQYEYLFMTLKPHKFTAAKFNAADSSLLNLFEYREG